MENSEIIVKFNDTEDLFRFVNSLNESIPCDVNASYENHVVDAKSIIGMAELSMHAITVKAVTSDEIILGKFAEICERYKVS